MASNLIDLGSLAFRDYATVGVPSSGAHDPEKADIRALFPLVAITNVVDVKSAAYTVVSSDKGKTLELTGNFYALTFGAAASYDADFTVVAVNASSTRGKSIVLTGYATFRLYPRQMIMVFRINGTWQVFRQNRYRKPVSAFTFHIDAVLGSNDYDGLAAGAGGSLLTGQEAIDRALGDIDCSAGLSADSIVLQFADGDYDKLHFGGMPAGAVNHQALSVRGNSADNSAVRFISADANQAAIVAGMCQVEIVDITVSTTASGADGIRLTNKGRAYLNNCRYEDCLGAHLAVEGQSSALIGGGALGETIAGDAGTHWKTEGRGVIDMPSGQTVFFETNAAFTFFAYAQTADILVPSVVVDLNGKTVTGQRYNVSNFGVINTQTAGAANTLPGNSAGTDNSGTGLYI